MQFMGAEVFYILNSIWCLTEYVRTGLRLKLFPVSWLLVQMEVGMQWGVSHETFHEVVSPAVQ